jgi:hypothetical protein
MSQPKPQQMKQADLQDQYHFTDTALLGQLTEARFSRIALYLLSR